MEAAAAGAVAPGPGSAAAFSACHVAKHYRLERHVVRVLEDVTFTVNEGEWMALVGPSGCGKTTLLHLLGALDAPSGGRICCRGRAYADLSSRRRAFLRRDKLGFVFQSYYLFPELNALENVVLPALQWRRDRRAACRRAEALLTEFGLAHRLRHRPQELSGGEQQRVALARALINAPDILLADEPTGNLDAASSEEIVGILRRLHCERGKTIVMVTHDAMLAGLADRVLRLEAGRVLPVSSGRDEVSG